jgi:hypothetical protein
MQLRYARRCFHSTNQSSVGSELMQKSHNEPRNFLGGKEPRCGSGSRVGVYSDSTKFLTRHQLSCIMEPWNHYLPEQGGTTMSGAETGDRFVQAKLRNAYMSPSPRTTEHHGRVSREGATHCPAPCGTSPGTVNTMLIAGLSQSGFQHGLDNAGPWHRTFEFSQAGGATDPGTMSLFHSCSYAPR